MSLARPFASRSRQSPSPAPWSSRKRRSPTKSGGSHELNPSETFWFAPRATICGPTPPPKTADFFGKAAGFFDYGPQCLIGLAAANLAAATAAGLTGLFGYLSTILSGWGLGA